MADFLADLHAYSLTNLDWLLDADLAFNGVRLNDRVRGREDEVRNALTILAQDLPAIKKYVDRAHELYSCLHPDGIIWLPRDEDNEPVVICSGDLWMNNILWKKDNEGQPSDSLAAVVDWQVDCVYFLLLSKEHKRIFFIIMREFFNFLTQMSPPIFRILKLMQYAIS